MKDRLKFLIQYKTGMRIGEVNAIEYSWIDQNSKIHLSSRKRLQNQNKSEISQLT